LNLSPLNCAAFGYVALLLVVVVFSHYDCWNMESLFAHRATHLLFIMWSGKNEKNVHWFVSWLFISDIFARPSNIEPLVDSVQK
jgi:hypothetical protein